MSLAITNRDGVINIGNKNKVKNEVKHMKSIPDAKDEALSILTKMLELVKELEDTNTKGDLLDDFDGLRAEVLSPTPEKSKVERAFRRIENILTPIKHITTVTTLFAHLNTLLPVISTVVGSAT